MPWTPPPHDPDPLRGVPMPPIPPAEITRMIQRRLALAEMARRHTELEAYPGEAEEVAQRWLAEAIGWASR